MILVAGMTRSGLSLTMQMLHAAGVPCAGEPPAFECFGVGRIPWQSLPGDVAVKLVDPHLHLPPDGSYDVIVPRRDLHQQALSFNKWAEAFTLPRVPPSVLKSSLRADYITLQPWLRAQGRYLQVTFDSLVCEPRVAAAMIADFLRRDLDLDAMAACVVPRGPECLDRLLEVDLIRRYDAAKAELHEREGGRPE